ncbi:hypothetical protein GH849_31700 [Bacillus thuringiensis]|nr:hypothetical protein [Bacillus thuringiensis]MRD45516.1 hypothetical protein [Bacillus thuringiensis]
MIRYKLTKSDKDFPVGTPVFIEIDNDTAYIEYYGDHPVGYTAEYIEYEGERHRVIVFPWSFLKVFGYRAEVDE